MDQRGFLIVIFVLVVHVYHAGSTNYTILLTAGKTIIFPHRFILSLSQITMLYDPPTRPHIFGILFATRPDKVVLPICQRVLFPPLAYISFQPGEGLLTTDDRPSIMYLHGRRCSLLARVDAATKLDVTYKVDLCRSPHELHAVRGVFQTHPAERPLCRFLLLSTSLYLSAPLVVPIFRTLYLLPLPVRLSPLPLHLLHTLT